MKNFKIISLVALGFIFYLAYIGALVGCNGGSRKDSLKQHTGRVFVRYKSMRADTLQLNWTGVLQLYQKTSTCYVLEDDNANVLAVDVIAFSIIEQGTEQQPEEKTEK